MNAKGLNICKEWSFASINVNPSVSIWRINSFESKFLRKVYLNAFSNETNLVYLFLWLLEEGRNENDTDNENFHNIIIDYCCKILGHRETQKTILLAFANVILLIRYFSRDLWIQNTSLFFPWSYFLSLYKNWNASQHQSRDKKAHLTEKLLLLLVKFLYS